ncbi:MAG: gamma-glutamylcyclotransferase family protein [Pseudomonadota bacterium]
MTHPCFFGYGSLVNRATHDHANAHPARVRGWRRAWVQTSLRARPYLTAVPSSGSEILGLVAEVDGDWTALDRREEAYARHTLDDIEHPMGTERNVRIYAVDPGHFADASSAPEPLILSYIDVVAQGYLQVFGEDGLNHFFETTDGWHHPVQNDRADPIYPRAQSLSREETDMTDTALRAVGARVL